MPPSPSPNDALDVFRHAAVDDRDELRQTATLLLYLRWRPDAKNAATSVLNDLAKRVTIRGTLLRRRDRQMLDFLSGLSILIYVNHCDEQPVIDETSALWHRVLKDRLRLHLLNRAALERFITPVVAQVYSSRIDSLLAELQDPRAIFTAGNEQKDLFRAIVPRLDPDTRLTDDWDGLAALLQSDVVLMRIVAAAVLAVHAYRDPDETAARITELFERLDGRGRQWALMAFSVLFPTPDAWVGLLEELTRRFVEDERAAFIAADSGMAAAFDIDLLPLGLAYGKQGGAMPYFEQLLSSAIERQDVELARRCIDGLAPVGFYYPAGVFETIRSGAPDAFGRNLPELRDSLVDTLAVIRSLHADAVDLFLVEMGADEVVRNEVASRSEAEVVRRYVLWIGFYNNAVHQALFCPWMRRELLVGALQALAGAKNQREFVRKITPAPLRMLREADYCLVEWTRRD